MEDMTEEQTLHICCEYLAKILCKRASELNLLDIKYCLEGITDRETGKSLGKVIIIWEKDIDTDMSDSRMNT